MARQKKGHIVVCPFFCGISARNPTVRPSYDGLSLTGKDIVATMLRRCVPYGAPKRKHPSGVFLFGKPTVAKRRSIARDFIGCFSFWQADGSEADVMARDFVGCFSFWQADGSEAEINGAERSAVYFSLSS